MYSDLDLDLDFDTKEVEVSTSYEPLPDGWYSVNITKVEVKPTKAGTGKRLMVSCRVTDGEHRGRSVLCGLNVANPNPVAQEIGRKQLRVLLQSVDLDGARDMSLLIGKETLAQVVYKESQNGYPASNDIKSFKPSGAKTSAPVASGAKKPSFM
jgi:hypothetical protein